MPPPPSSEEISSIFKNILGSDESSEDEVKIEEWKVVETQEKDTIGD